MWWKAIVVIALFCAPFSDGSTQFSLNFVHSTNRILVTDYYYMLEYSIVRGRQTRKSANIEVKDFNQISINVQMITKFNQSHSAPDQVAL